MLIIINNNCKEGYWKARQTQCFTILGFDTGKLPQ